VDRAKIGIVISVPFCPHPKESDKEFFCLTV